MWRFTKHALQRMAERGYTETEILLILEGEVPCYIFPSPRETTVDLFFGRGGDRYIFLPVDREKEAVITVRPMSRNERAIFQAEVHHD